MAQYRSVIPGNIDNVDKTVFAIIDGILKRHKPIWTKYYNKDTSDRKFERNMSYAMFGQAPLKPEGADYQTQLIQQGWTKDFTHLEFGLAWECTQTAQEDDLEDILAQYARGLGLSCLITQEQYAADVLNDGFTTQTSPDGQPIFAAAHPLVRGGTARNTRSSDLSWNAMQQMLIDLNTDQKSEEGFFTNPQTGLQLVVPPQNMLTAQRLVKSSGLPGSADNDINPINSDYSIDIVVNPYLDDPDSWYILYKGKQHGILSYERVPITMQPPERISRSQNRYYAIRFRQSWGARAWQGTWASPGA